MRLYVHEVLFDETIWAQVNSPFISLWQILFFSCYKLHCSQSFTFIWLICRLCWSVWSHKRFWNRELQNNTRSGKTTLRTWEYWVVLQWQNWVIVHFWEVLKWLQHTTNPLKNLSFTRTN
jgi:hypothetical protein